LLVKPEVHGHRRYAVLLATAESSAAALLKDERAYSKLQVEILPINA
jgi:formate-dependent phosphoribosylglycinamide formyltransferase (GAR transformylase)